ncbi:MAG: aminoacyl-tRNA hydrolase [Magnetococcales bacterium]|nr:aminoacyl-tRNA hydrolase [Magnetococcales bacterium]MBF0150039.1 aminoacyl-tRNA hydrolase [Magnetococcales bacterium]MBF0173505.1 aminoacyl-tRNA hydrolase [Magnetococcales bacterium]
MILLVGLGNPGPKYQGTRHNIGFDAVECLVRHFGLSTGGTRFGGWFGTGRVEGQSAAWLCPQTYMNLSGNSVGEAVRFYQLPLNQVVVFHDDLDLAPGRIKIKQGGGHGGHNGLKSIQQVLSSPDFLRVRLGIGRPPGTMDPARYVLDSFAMEERTMMDASLAKLPDMIPFLLQGDVSGAMNHLGRMVQQPGNPKEVS